MRPLLVLGGVGAAVSLVLLWRRRRDLLDYLLDELEDLQRARAFDHLPERIILLRHGESQANVDPSILATTPDNQIELTPRGREQAREAGRRIKALLGASDDGAGGPVATVVLSPFERTQQTLCCLVETLGEGAVREVHVDSRVCAPPPPPPPPPAVAFFACCLQPPPPPHPLVRRREQEFGNLQEYEAMAEDRQLAALVGRFYYRRNNGESSADVYDRASDLWESICSGYSIRTRFAPRHSHAWSAVAHDDRALLIVTHGLTMRLLLMRLFSWSVDTFECVFVSQARPVASPDLPWWPPVTSRDLP
jgi:broad specificity phosphatase PhoE